VEGSFKIGSIRRDSREKKGSTGVDEEERRRIGLGAGLGEEG